MRSIKLCAVILLTLVWSAHTASAATLEQLMDLYQTYDRNGDGIDEIEFLSPLFPPPAGLGPNEELVVVFVEPRLLQTLPSYLKTNDTAQDVMDALLQLRDDLRGDGFASVFVLADVYDGGKDQDGLTVLALRDFLIDVRKSFCGLKGTMLIGNFPESKLVRQQFWVSRHDKGEGNKIAGKALKINDMFVHAKAGILAHRSDLVLGDLDGGWDKLYNLNLSAQGFGARIDGKSLSVGKFKSCLYEKHTYKDSDAFFIADAGFTGMKESGGCLTLNITKLSAGLELSAADKGLINPIARPEIQVSRINAKHVAMSPGYWLVDKNGKHVVGKDGKPQIVSATNKYGSQFQNDSGFSWWKQDLALERRLILEYLERNHDFRTGQYDHLPFRAAGISYELGSATGSSNELSTAMSKAGATPSTPVVANNAPLLDYVNWLKKPAILRSIWAHSNGTVSNFGDKYQHGQLVAATGTPWRWKKFGGEFAGVYPSFVDQGKSANFYLYRTLWENNKLDGAGPQMFIHQGCEVNSPIWDGAYTSGSYGKAQNAEGQLFYLNGLAVLSRAKVFYDGPEGLKSAWTGPRSVFGSALTTYYNTLSKETLFKQAQKMPYGWGVATQGDPRVNRKRSYSWSVNGDWSLRLRYERLVNGKGKYTSAAQGKPRELVFEVPVGAAELKVMMTPGWSGGDADLFVKHGAAINWSKENKYQNSPTFKAQYKNGSNETVIFKNPAPGTWYVGINAYSGNPAAVVSAQLKGLTNNVYTTATVNNYAVQDFQINVPAGATRLDVDMYGSGDGDLYVKHGAMPANYKGFHNSATFKAPYKGGSSESVSFDYPASGTWHVRVYGYSGNPKITLSSYVETAPEATYRTFGVWKGGTKQWTIDVPAGVAEMTVHQGGTGDADLYVKRAAFSWPSDKGYKNQPEFKAGYNSGTNETVVFQKPAAGQWHVLVHGYQHAGGHVTVTFD